MTLPEIIAGYFIVILVTAIVVHAYDVKVHSLIESKPTPSLYNSWIDFIAVNIASCNTIEAMAACQDMILLFSEKFVKIMPPSIVNSQVENLWNRYDTRLKYIASMIN